MDKCLTFKDKLNPRILFATHACLLQIMFFNILIAFAAFKKAIKLVKFETFLVYACTQANWFVNAVLVFEDEKSNFDS